MPPLAASNRATGAGENGGKWLRKRYIDPERGPCDITGRELFVIVSGQSLRTQIKTAGFTQHINRSETVIMKATNVLCLGTRRRVLHFWGNSWPKDGAA